MSSTLEASFNAAMQAIYRQAKEQLGYNATRFLQLISELGGVQAAKKLLIGSEAQYGLQVLWEGGRLDLSVEAHVLKPEFAGLFTEEERDRARARLRDYGWTD